MNITVAIDSFKCSLTSMEAGEAIKEGILRVCPNALALADGGEGTAYALTVGMNAVLEETQLRDYIKEADIVITGEGRLDAQTVMGKAAMGVAKLAKEYGKTVIAFAGSVMKDALEQVFRLIQILTIDE